MKYRTKKILGQGAYGKVF